MPDLNEYNSAVRVIEAVKAAAAGVVAQNVPQLQFATVVSVDRMNRQATVRYANDTTNTTIRILADDGPWGVGDIVEVLSGRVQRVIYSATAPGGTMISAAMIDGVFASGTQGNPAETFRKHYASCIGNPGATNAWYVGRWITSGNPNGWLDVTIRQSSTDGQCIAQYSVPIIFSESAGAYVKVPSAAKSSILIASSALDIGLEIATGDDTLGNTVLDVRIRQIGTDVDPTGDGLIRTDVELKGNWHQDITFTEHLVTDAAPSAYKAESGVSDREPTGVIKMFGGSTAPLGYLPCDGTAVSRTTYAHLFSVIGTVYGAGNGTTTFNVPNFTSAFPRGNTPGATGGASTHTHPLSGAGAAKMSWAAASAAVAMVRATAMSWTSSTKTLAIPGTSPSSNMPGLTADSTAETSGIELTGATDSASTLPPYEGVLFIIRT